MIPEIFQTTYTEDLYRISEKLTVVIHQPWDKFTSDELTLLGKILASVKQSLYAARIVHLSEINTALLPAGSKIISFGVSVIPEIQAYQCVRINESSVIYADLLGALDDVRKKNLWTALKLAFT